MPPRVAAESSESVMCFTLPLKRRPNLFISALRSEQMIGNRQIRTGDHATIAATATNVERCVLEMNVTMCIVFHANAVFNLYVH